MPNHKVSVLQLAAFTYKKKGISPFFNVNESIYGAVCVWTSRLPYTYLLKIDHVIVFLQFEDAEVAQEYFSDHPNAEILWQMR